MELKRDLTKMTSSFHEVMENNTALSLEIQKTKNLQHHSSLSEGDSERARQQLAIQEYLQMCRA